MQLSAKAITQASYENTAEAFAKNVADLAPLESIQKFISLLPKSASILDLGCGSGRDAKIMSALGASVLGIDYCSALIKIAKAETPLARFECMDFENLDFAPESFDGIWSACSLAHLEKKQFPIMLDTIRSLIKPKGYFYLALKEGRGEQLEADSRYENHPKKFWAYYEKEELLNHLEKAPFKIIEFKAAPKSHPYLSHSALAVLCQK